MKQRQPARKGLTYLDANRGRLITEGPDVLRIKDEIHARWPGVLECYFDTDTLKWVIVEKCADGVERMVMQTARLDRRVIEKLERIDQAAHAQGDVNKKLEAEDVQAERDKEHELSEAIGEPIERFEHALLGSGVLGVNKLIVADGKYIKPGKKTVKAAG